MVAYPDTAHLLTERERKIVMLANEADRALKAHETFDRKQILSAFTDWRTYLWALLFFANYVPVYSIILSLPTVVTGLGFHGTTATLMACPPYGFGFVIVLISGWTVDKYGYRFYHYIASILITMIALIVLMAETNDNVRYGMFFLVMFMSVYLSSFVLTHF